MSLVSPLQGHLSPGHRQPAGGDGATVLHSAGRKTPPCAAVIFPTTLADCDGCHPLLLLSPPLQNEIHGLIERYSVNESLVEEIEKLREENRKLKANY